MKIQSKNTMKSFSEIVRSKIHSFDIRQFTGFSLVGAINFVVSYVSYAISIYFGIHHQIANQISFWLTLINGYLLNKYWVFKKAGNGSNNKELFRYFTVYGLNFVLGIFLLYLYVDILNINKYIVPFVSMPVTIPLNYYLNKKWVFAKKQA